MREAQAESVLRRRHVAGKRRDAMGGSKGAGLGPDKESERLRTGVLHARHPSTPRRRNPVAFRSAEKYAAAAAPFLSAAART